MSTTFLVHGRVQLALHQLRDARPGGDGTPPLLLLHELGGRAPTELGTDEAAWPGAVHALDFTGHGESTVPRGGGYHPEILMGDADAALAALGSATILGRGLGGYIAVLLAGGRPREVRGVVVADGAGLAGGGPEPRGPRILRPEGPVAPEAPDPFARLELADDVRPPDYVALFARLAESQSGLAHPITVAAEERPAWVHQLLAEPGVAVRSIADGLADYASHTLHR